MFFFFFFYIIVETYIQYVFLYPELIYQLQCYECLLIIKHSHMSKHYL